MTTQHPPFAGEWVATVPYGTAPARTLRQYLGALASYVPGICVLGDPDAAADLAARRERLQIQTRRAGAVETIHGSPFLAFAVVGDMRDGGTVAEPPMDTPLSEMAAVRWCTVPVDLDLSGDSLVAYIDGAPFPVDPRTVSDRKRDVVRRYAQRRASGRVTRSPGAVVQLFRAAASWSRSEEDRMADLADRVEVSETTTREGFRTHVTGYRISVELDPKSRRQAADSGRRGRRKLDPAQAVLAFDRERGTADELSELALRTLAAFDTSALQSLMAMAAMAHDTGGLVIHNVKRLAELRGITGSGSQRRTMARHFELFASVEFLVWSEEKRGHYQRLPLLVYDRTIGIQRRGEARAFRFHPELWDRMNSRGLSLVWDRAILQADPRRDEWAVRVYYDLAGRWSRGWVAGGLHETGGALRISARALLAGAAVPYEGVLRGRGPAALRRRVRRTLETLQRFPAPGGGPPARLVGEFDIDAGSDPLDDMLTVRPAPSVAEALTEHRRRGIDAKRKADARRLAAGAASAS